MQVQPGVQINAYDFQNENRAIQKEGKPLPSPMDVLSESDLSLEEWVDLERVEVAKSEKSSYWSTWADFPFFGTKNPVPLELVLNLSRVKEGKLFNRLLAAASDNQDCLNPLLCDLFGERLVKQVLDKFDFNAIQPLSLKIHLMLAAISADVTVEDVRDLHSRLRNKELSLNDLSCCLPIDFSKAEELSSKAFEELNAEEFTVFLNVYRLQSQKDGTTTCAQIDPKLLAHSGLDKAFPQLKTEAFRLIQLGEVIEAGDLFQHSELTKQAEDEFFSRVAAYAPLREKMIVSYMPHGATAPAHFEVKKAIDENGFGCFFLENLHKNGDQTQIKVLFRGTDFLDLQSARACLTPSAGSRAYEKKQKEIEDSLYDLLSGHENVSLEATGHSQGASIAQLFTVDLAAHLVKAKKEKNPSPLCAVTNVSMRVWNPPAILEKKAKELDASIKELNDLQNSCRFQLSYLRVSTDIVHRFGEVYAGYGVNSPNMEVELIKFSPTNECKLAFGPHRNYILTKGREDYRILQRHDIGEYEELQAVLRDTTYQRLSPSTQKVAGAAVNVIKRGVYTLTNDEAPAHQRVGVALTGAAVIIGSAATVVAIPGLILPVSMAGSAIATFGVASVMAAGAWFGWNQAAPILLGDSLVG